MSTLTLTSHVIDRLTGTRPLMSLELLHEIAQHISTKLDRFDRNSVHQVALKVYTYDDTMQLGNSYGNCLIIAIDIRKMVIPTAFLRNEWQGRPKMAQVMINLDGEIIG